MKNIICQTYNDNVYRGALHAMMLGMQTFKVGAGIFWTKQVIDTMMNDIANGALDTIYAYKNILDKCGDVTDIK